MTATIPTLLLSIINDADCDGILTVDDCDDTDATIGSNGNDLVVMVCRHGMTAMI